jgi:hypothetical protein
MLNPGLERDELISANFAETNSVLANFAETK